MDNYIVLYGDKKKEDNLCITNMFDATKQIRLGWTDSDLSYNQKLMTEQIETNKVNQLIFSGLEIGWDKLIVWCKENYPMVKIKVICNTSEALLYYEYERENFFRLLELSKQKVVDVIAFLKKGQYELYKSLGYSCQFLRQKYSLKPQIAEKLSNKEEAKEQGNTKLSIGIYPLNYTWDKNIFNQLCIGKFIDSCVIRHSDLDDRMNEFMDTMEIENIPSKIEITEESILQEIQKNDCIVAASFTEYFHPIFFMSMELGIPCLIGDNSDLWEENDGLRKWVTTQAEDNAILNSQEVQEILNHKAEIMQEYEKWKLEYQKKADQSIQELLQR